MKALLAGKEGLAWAWPSAAEKPIVCGLESGLRALPSARELRALAGIGPKRSLALAEALWRSGWPRDEQAWDRIAGIGPKTARQLQCALMVQENKEACAPLVPRRADLRLGAADP